MQHVINEYKTFNIPFHQISKNKHIEDIIFDAVKRTNKIVIHSYQFIRLWILNKYHTNQNIPEINNDIFRLSFIVLNDNNEKKKEQAIVIGKNERCEKIIDPQLMVYFG